MFDSSLFFLPDNWAINFRWKESLPCNAKIQSEEQDSLILGSAFQSFRFICMCFVDFWRQLILQIIYNLILLSVFRYFVHIHFMFVLLCLSTGCFILGFQVEVMMYILFRWNRFCTRSKVHSINCSHKLTTASDEDGIYFSNDMSWRSSISTRSVHKQVQFMVVVRCFYLTISNRGILLSAKLVSLLSAPRINWKLIWHHVDEYRKQHGTTYDGD